MHSLWLFFLKKQSFTYLLMFSLVAAGTFSLISIPKESSPEVIIPVGIVTTVLRGATAEACQNDSRKACGTRRSQRCQRTGAASPRRGT